MVLFHSYFDPIKAADSDTQGFHSQFLRNQRANPTFSFKNSVLLIFGRKRITGLNKSDRQVLPF